MTTEPDAIKENRETWNRVCDLFVDASALPDWGPFGVGGDLDLLGEIGGKTFLDIGCGSGRSVAYLLQSGARKVYGLDLSPRQLEEARRFNADSVQSGHAVFLEGRMEDRLDLEPIDAVVSVYAVGWTVSPADTFRNIFACLKPGGLFAWSWDHTFFTDVQYDEETSEFVVRYSYHDEHPLVLEDWRKQGARAYITYRKTSTWFRLLGEAGFDIVGYHEPEPRNLNRAHDDPHKHYSIQKASKVPSSFIFVCRKPA